MAATAPPAPLFVAAFYVALGAITEIVGKAKTAGKSTFLAHLVAAIVHGTPFLGRPTTQTAVVWLTEERGATFIEILKRGALTTSTNLHVLHWHDVSGVPFPTVVAAAVEQCGLVGAGVLIVDTVSQFGNLGGDSENNSGSALEALAPLQRAAAAGLAVLAVRHERKGGGDVGESGRGSSAFVGGVDIHVAVRRPEGQARPTLRVLRALSRFTETPDELVIDLTPAGYVALGSEASVAVLEAKRAIVDRLPDSADAAVDLDVICGFTEPPMKRTNAQRALKELGGVQRSGKGRKADPYRYFRAVDVSAQTPITTVGGNL